MPRKKKARGRPPVNPMPERINATPKQIAEAFLRLPADYQSRYLISSNSIDIWFYRPADLALQAPGQRSLLRRRD